MADVVVNVSGNEEIQMAISVIIAKTCSCRPIAESDSCLFCKIGEGAIVVVMVEAIFPEVRYIKIGPAVVIVIAHPYAIAPTIVCHTCFGSNIRECAIVVVVKEGGVWSFGLAVESVIGGSVHQIDVDPAIMVVVKQCHT